MLYFVRKYLELNAPRPEGGTIKCVDVKVDRSIIIVGGVVRGLSAESYEIRIIVGCSSCRDEYDP
jgi:hypothetical protein